MNGAAAHAHGVHDGYAGSRDIVAVAHAAGRLPANVLPEFRAACLDEIEQALARGVERADRYRRQGLIVAAYLVLQGETRVLAPPELQLTRPAS